MTEEKFETGASPEPGPAAEPAKEPEAKGRAAKKGGGGGPVDAVWKFFSSVHLAVILLLVLASISIIGTILAQGDSAEDNVKIFEGFVVKVFDLAGIVDADNPASVNAKHERIHAVAERLTRLSTRAGFTNLYHAWYFYLLLALFSLNLTVCSLKRWPHTWKVIAKNPVLQEERRLRAMAERRSLFLPLAPAEAADRVREALKKAGYAPTRQADGETVGLFAQKGRYSRLGVYSTHMSIIIILLGGIIGVTTGFKGYMQIVEGTSESRFWDRRTKTQKQFAFQVRCDNFQVDYYPGGRMPKDYYSDLTVIKDGREVMSKRIEVNSPLVYDDAGSPMADWPVVGWFVPKIFFYQSSYGETGRGVKATLAIKDPGTGETHRERLDTRPVEVPGLGGTVQVVQVLPDFALDENQRPYSKSSQSNNPAALVEVRDAEGKAWRTWLFQQWPEVKMSKDFPYEITFVDYGGVQYTGLQVVYDPGVWVIWMGCLIMVVGLYLAFFTSHRRVWARVDAAEGGAAVVVAGSANKNRDAFTEEFARLADLVEGKS